MKQRGLKYLLAACIVCFIWSTSAEAQKCLSEPTLSAATAWLHNRPHPFDGFGFRYATVNYSGGPNAPSPEVRAVLEDAVLQWNLQGCRTGILLIPTPVDGDLEFSRTLTDGPLTGDCAFYHFPSAEINYGPAFLNRLTTLGPTQARAGIMHEIGHFLGLDHTNFPLPPTIMTQVDTCSSPVAVTSVSAADATKAGECLNSGEPCVVWLFVPPVGPFECEQGGGYWNFTFPGCFPTPQPEPCIDCWFDEDCCYGDVCVSGTCAPPPPICDPECPPGDFCLEGVCFYTTPIVIDVNGDGFRLTNAAGGVDFDFAGDGQPQRIPWTANGSDDAWLVLDRNHNGRIDNGREMFGNASLQPKVAQKDRNGFIALSEFDKFGRGGTGDGLINREDYIFRKLQLWTDSNHNGISETTELSSLEQMNVAVLELGYKLSSRTDRYGNEFRYRAKIMDASGVQPGRWAWDVILKGRGK